MFGIYDFNGIKKKADFLRCVAEKLDEMLYGTEWTDLPKEAYDVLANYEFAPLIATICDEGIKGKDAWSMPWWFSKRIGSLEPDDILKEDISDILKSYFDSGQGSFPPYMSEEDRQKWLDKISGYIRGALTWFRNRNTTPIKIFENREYEAVEVYFILRGIDGFGPKKASMIVRDFVYMSKGLAERHPWFDQIKDVSPDFKVTGEDKTFVPIDVHVVKVFNRIFGRKWSNWKTEQKEHWWDLDIQMFSKLTFPEFPARLDRLLWYVGVNFCKNDWKWARCSECPINSICDSSKVK
jgi:hypothetical protein